MKCGLIESVGLIEEGGLIEGGLNRGGLNRGMLNRGWGLIEGGD